MSSIVRNGPFKNPKELTREQELGLKEPLQLLNDKFWQMKEETTEENLKDFLNSFKLNSSKFQVSKI